MPVNHYECLFLLDSAKTSGNMDTAKSQLHATLEKYGAEILASRPWDDRRLAYPIKGHKKGQYYLTFFKADSLKITEMEHDFRLSDLILRHLVSHIDPKWLNEMIEVAKDPHRLAYQAMREEAPEGGGGGTEPGAPMEVVEGGEGEGKPRRRPRTEGEAKE
jgi:small subunit ribosomal protein S6